MNWQPIETAPKDGTRILVNDGWSDYKAYYDEKIDGFIGIRRGYDINEFKLMGLNKWKHLPEIDYDKKNRR